MGKGAKHRGAEVSVVAQTRRQDDEVVRWASNAPLEHLADVAQYMWARAYYPGATHTVAVLARIGLLAPERAEALERMLVVAEEGTTSDRALYSAFGARAIRNVAG